MECVFRTWKMRLLHSRNIYFVKVHAINSRPDSEVALSNERNHKFSMTKANIFVLNLKMIQRRFSFLRDRLSLRLRFHGNGISVNYVVKHSQKQSNRTNFTVIRASSSLKRSLWRTMVRPKASMTRHNNLIV